MLLRGQVMAVAAHEREQPAVLGADRIELLPASQEVMVHGADDMKAIGHDLCLRKVFPDQRPIGRCQIHANQLHQMLAFQPIQIALQRRLAAAEHHVEDLVMPQIAEGGGIAAPARKEVFVNAQNTRAFADPLARP